ncbi:phosphatase PAP2 family protein [Tuberibacillus sp. Marseille-P3662]|uniref:phosphatase PAP2 family protein n=1 Tax=Tuberibacillus sp. Marseille-P3662 TaxID=1965358 RepID=UPI000A1C90EE|nr:phosphatase PAP2 family protein [Tuberibacillus sp. Marseille-P3662]
MTVIQKRNFLFTGMFVLAVLFIIVALNYHNSNWLVLGKEIQSYLYDFWGTIGDGLFVVITYIGSGYVAFPLTGIIVIFLLLRKNYGMAGLLVLNLLGVRQLNRLLKLIFARPRPDLEHLVTVSYYSFPSGHAMNSIAFFGLLAYLLRSRLKNKGYDFRFIWLAAALLIFLIGLSRVYLGVHYPMDVLGGFLAGGSWLCFTLLLHSVFFENIRHEELLKERN